MACISSRLESRSEGRVAAEEEVCNYADGPDVAVGGVSSV